MAICEAAAKLFIPIQTLNIAKVRVLTVKNSTVPKSEITSMQTRESPAIMAGLARGSPTFKNGFLLCNFATSNRLDGLFKNDTLEKMYTYGYSTDDITNIAPPRDLISGNQYSLGELQPKIDLKVI